jgi:hypothetical protein
MAAEPAELKALDISAMPEVRRLAEEVQASNEPRLLQRDGEDVAILMPVPPARKAARSRRGPLTREDALFQLVGIGSSDVPGGVSGKKHEYYARAHRQHRQ